MVHSGSQNGSKNGTKLIKNKFKHESKVEFVFLSIFDALIVLFISIGFDVFVGLLFDISFTSLVENTKLENMRLDM